MTVITQGTIPPEVAFLEEIAKQCDAEVQAKEKVRTDQKKKKATCQKLGQDKHKCCDDKIKAHNKKDPPEDPKVEGETGYERPKVDDQTGLISANKTPLTTSRGALISAAAKKGAAAAKGLSNKGVKKAVRKAIGKALGGTVWPDAAIVGPPKRMVDFKFSCPESHRSKKKSTKKNYKKPKQSPDQEAAHNALGDGPTITIQI